MFAFDLNQLFNNYLSVSLQVFYSAELFPVDGVHEENPWQDFFNMFLIIFNVIYP